MLIWYRSNRNLMYVLNCSVVSDSMWPHGLLPARFHCPWGFPDKNTGVGCNFLCRLSSQPRDWTQDSSIAGGFFLTVWITREPKSTEMGSPSLPQGIFFLTQGLNQVSCIAGGFFTSWATWEAPRNLRHGPITLLLNHCKESMQP